MIRKEKSLSIGGFSGKKKRTKFIRPNSAISKNKLYSLKVNNGYYNQVPPPIIFTMPNNKKMISGMGNNIEREQLYENNMQLKESLNKIKRELAETKYFVVKKDIELREKEKIIRDCLKENDLESSHEGKIEKAKESALLTLFKEKYNNLKNSYEKEIQENKILKANIKITKIKEFQIENDILNQELVKIKSLYENCKKNLKKYKGVINDLNHFKEKFLEQHSIISSYVQKCDLLSAEIRNLKEERDNLQRELEINMKKQEVLKQSNDKLKIKNIKFLNQKKIKEELNFKNADNEKNLLKFKKDAFEYKKAFLQKIADYDTLKKAYDAYEQKINRINESLLKPFQYKNIKHIEKENNPKNIDKIELYKSLYNESQMKNIIYEKYFKEKNINPKDIIREYGFSGVLNTENRLLLINNKDKNNSKINNEKEENINIKNKKQEENKDKNSHENLINKPGDKIKINNSNNINNNYDNINNKSNNKNEIIDNNIIKEEEEVEKEEEKENINQIDAGNDEIRTKISDDNFSNTNTFTRANTNYNNNNINNNINNNNVNSNFESDKIEEIEENDNNFLMIIHLFLKNFEGNHITSEIANNKMKNIIQSFEGKTEITKEDFILPFYNLFIESMKTTQETDKQFVKNFLDNYLESLNGDTNEFFNELSAIFENLADYSSLENERTLDALAFSLQKFKNELEKKLKEEDKDGLNLITFDSFRKIVNELNIPLNDDLMEFLIYKMKSSVPDNNSIFHLNYKFILEILNRENPNNLDENERNNEDEDEKDNDDLSRQISEKLSEFKNNMINKNTDLEKVCMGKIQKFNDENNSFELIEKDAFFEIMEKYGVTLNEEIKETIYRLFINEEPNFTKNVMMMDFKKLKNLFLHDYYSEES